MTRKPGCEALTIHLKAYCVAELFCLTGFGEEPEK